MSAKRKVAINDVKPGMYVVELDRPWEEVPFQAPFELQGFTIRTPADLERVGRFCDFVYIDPQLGVEAERYLDVPIKKQAVGIYERLYGIPVDTEEPVYEDLAVVEEEVTVARQIVDDTRAVYQNVIEDLKAGRMIDTTSVKKTVGTLVESIIRNPDAASLLIRLKRKDSYTYTHSMAVCVTGLAMGRHVGLPTKELNTLGSALLLQDVGKIQVPEDLLMRKEEITRRERNLLNLHVDASVAMLRANSELDPTVIEIVHTHHERYDGSGYPRGLKGDALPLAGAMAGLVDSYVAMTSHRPYRAAKTPFEALMTLYNERDAQFPAAVVERLIRCVGIFPVGSFVELNNGEIGVVISRNNTVQLKPRVMMILGADGARLTAAKTLDLADSDSNDADEALRITKVVDPSEHDLDPQEFFA